MSIEGSAPNRRRVVDAHSDFLCDLFYRRRQGETKVLERLYLPQYRIGSVSAVVAAIYLETLFVPHMALEVALEMISCLKLELEESPGLFRLCRTAGDLDEALSRGQIAILLSLEGAEPIGSNLKLLQVFHELGVRLMGLTWARRNAAADGASMTFGGRCSKAGLTAFGRELVAEAVRLGIALDVSHLNDAGFNDLSVLTNKPLFASHSNARALADKERNLPDDAIRHIAARGGVIGVNTVNTLIAREDSESTVERVADHIEYIGGIAGRGHVGLGLDFCEHLPEYAPPMPLKPGERRIIDIVGGYDGVSGLLNVLDGRGFTAAETVGIAGENFLGFFRSALPKL
jgi:membrane dipeptidase